ncbi:MAG: hypothetical protein JZU50_11935, partial [Desulfobulbaceae bacterium]|nr:hypothetical protein [Desulfobulbaceae bacterium]
MKLNLKTPIAFIFFSFSLFITHSTLASDVYLKIDANEFGQGILRQRRHECLIIAPAHVVENAFKIDITTSDRSKYSAEVLELFPGDLSVLRFVNENPSLCRQTGWSTKTNLNALLEMEKQGELRTMLADGSIRITDVDIVSYDKYRNINIRPRNSLDAISKGESGSPLYIAGQFSGMLLSVKNDIGNVIRQDAMINTLSLFFGDTVKVGQLSRTHLNNSIKVTSNSPEKAPVNELEFSGVIAKSAVTV